jgi:hypothetical protein
MAHWGYRSEIADVAQATAAIDREMAALEPRQDIDPRSAALDLPIAAGLGGPAGSLCLHLVTQCLQLIDLGTDRGHGVVQGMPRRVSAGRAGTARTVPYCRQVAARRRLRRLWR